MEYYSAIKRTNCVLCRDVDDLETVIEREVKKRKKYINAYMWDLEKWYRWAYLQNSNRDTDIENIHMDAKGERGVNREIGIDMHTLQCLK